jgi:serine protease Do
MSTRKSTISYVVLTALVSIVVGIVIASRLDLVPRSLAGTLNIPAANSAPLTGPLDATTFRTIAHDASPAVVSITVTVTRQVRSLGDFFGLGPQLQQPRGNQRRQPQQQPDDQEYAEGAGSGFIIDKAGYILTNNHVVEDATDIHVFLQGKDGPGEAGLAAKVIGRDSLTDTALLQLTEMPKESLTEIKFGDSSQIAPGDWVMAIGNPFQLSNTVTVGVVSAVDRPRIATQSAGGIRSEEMIQTDAAINRGNSGGPLLNIRGEVIGINTMILSDQSGGNIGVGFAVPINKVRDLLPMLRQGKVVRGRLGVSVSRYAMTESDAKDLGLAQPAGALVSSLDAEGPAKAAGVKVGDVIVEFNGKAVKNSDDLVSMVSHTTPGTTVPLKIYRDKKAVSLNVKVGELDLEQENAQQTVREAPSRQRDTAPPAAKDTDFGMRIQEITPQIARELGITAGKGGAVIQSVDPRGAAARDGLQQGDVILSVNGRATTTVDQVSQALDQVESGTRARVVVLREGSETLVQVRKR